MTSASISTVIENFYKHFTNSDLEQLFALIDDDIIHSFNGHRVIGKEAFKQHIQTAEQYYDENIDGYILMASDDGEHATAKLKIKGTYIKTDESSIPATGQSYELEAINYFNVVDGLITAGECWFDDDEWADQILNSNNEANELVADQ